MIRKLFKPGNIFFVILLGFILYKPSRIKIQSWIMSSVGSPEVMNEPKVLSPSDMDFTFYNLEGDSFNLLNFKGEPIFLNFWATWCGPCMAEFPSIEKMVKGHKGNGEIFLISHEKPQVIRQFMEEKGMNLPIYYSTKVPRFVTSESIPLTYILDKEGKVVIEKTGAADWSDPHILELIK
jgi:thiol-disulfide isomerase/thioredoxin